MYVCMYTYVCMVRCISDIMFAMTILFLVLVSMSVAVTKGVMKTGQMKLAILTAKKVECLNVYGPLAIQQKYAKFTT